MAADRALGVGLLAWDDMPAPGSRKRGWGGQRGPKKSALIVTNIAISFNKSADNRKLVFLLKFALFKQDAVYH